MEILKKELEITEIEGFLTIKHERYSTVGRKKKGTKKDVIEYSLSLTISTDLTKFNEERERNAIFVLATNELDEEKLKMKEILNEKNIFLVHSKTKQKEKNEWCRIYQNDKRKKLRIK